MTARDDERVEILAVYTGLSDAAVSEREGAWAKAYGYDVGIPYCLSVAHPEQERQSTLRQNALEEIKRESQQQLLPLDGGLPQGVAGVGGACQLHELWPQRLNVP